MQVVAFKVLQQRHVDPLEILVRKWAGIENSISPKISLCILYHLVVPLHGVEQRVHHFPVFRNSPNRHFDLAFDGFQDRTAHELLHGQSMQVIRTVRNHGAALGCHQKIIDRAGAVVQEAGAHFKGDTGFCVDPASLFVLLLDATSCFCVTQLLQSTATPGPPPMIAIFESEPSLLSS